MEDLRDVPEAAWLWDGQRARIVWANTEGIAFFGAASMFDLIDRPFDFIEPGVERIVGLSRSLRRGQVETALLHFPSAGATAPIACRCMIHALADGRPGVLAVARDAAGVAAQKMSDDILAAFDVLPTAALLVGRDGNIRHLNAAALVLLAAGQRASLAALLGDADIAEDLLTRLATAGTISFVRSNPSLYRNLHINNVWTAELNGTGAYQWGQIGVGVANQGALLHSNNLGSRRRQINSAYVDYRGAWLNQRLILNAGISVHQVTDWGLHVFPGLDAGVRLSDALRIFGTVGSTWRAPTFTDLYYEDRLNVGNPDLQPESALTYETGIYWMPQHTSLRFGYFVRDGKNLIDWTKAAADDPWRPDNFGSVTYSGWEIEYQWWPTLPWIGYLYTSYNFINGINHAPESQFSRYALDHLKNQIQFHAQFQLTKKWNATFAYRFLDRENLDDYQLVDLRTGITWSHFECYLQLDNLFDAQYTETNLVPMPGRWVMMGIKVSLDYD